MVSVGSRRETAGLSKMSNIPSSTGVSNPAKSDEAVILVESIAKNKYCPELKT
jgi:hypothetical protein